MISEETIRPVTHANRDRAVCYIYRWQIFLGYLFSDLHQARNVSSQKFYSNPAHVVVVTAAFEGLTYCASAREAGNQKCLRKARGVRRIFEKWTNQKHVNILHYLLLLRAEDLTFGKFPNHGSAACLRRSDPCCWTTRNRPYAGHCEREACFILFTPGRLCLGIYIYASRLATLRGLGSPREVDATYREVRRNFGCIR